MSTDKNANHAKCCSTENNKVAAKHHEDTPKCHHDAAKHHTEGNCDKAKESDAKAKAHHCPECDTKK